MKSAGRQIDEQYYRIQEQARRITELEAALQALVSKEDEVSETWVDQGSGQIVDKRDERIRELEAALRALVEHPFSGISMTPLTWKWECTYCRYEHKRHAPDCPIVVGRKVLGGE
jgi:hypothetical protein